jgi:hypothetical protein
MELLTNRDKMGKPYTNGVKHNAYIGGQKVWNDVSLEFFSITVQDNGSFNIPTRGVNGGTTSYQSYDWEIDWGDGNIETVSETGTSSSAIPHTYSDGQSAHEIKIKPNGTPAQGWLNAFGCGSSSSDGPKIKSINTPITGLMRTVALYSHYNMFYGCTGLTSLPENLLPATALVSYSYNCMFYSCTGLTDIGNIDAAWFSSKTETQAGMFYNCTKIAIPIAYKDIPADWK